MAELNSNKPEVISTFKPYDNAEREFNRINYFCTYNGRLFNILMSPNAPLTFLPGYDFTNSIESQYLTRLEAVHVRYPSNKTEEEENNSIEVEEEIKEHVLNASRSMMHTLAPEMAQSDSSLYSAMYPETFSLQVITQQGKLAAVKRDDLSVFDFHTPITDPRVSDIHLPCHQASEIRILAQLFAATYKVQLANGQIIIPQLKGLINSHKGIVGFLMTYIESVDHKNLGGASDGGGLITSKLTISKAQREKRPRQIEETLLDLHSRNIIWGDVRMANVVIDEVTDDAWVVGFGLGRANLIDENLYGTKEGDLQGLEIIKKELAED